MMRTRLRHFMFKMGSQPEKSWRQFVTGLFIFAGGAGCIIIGQKDDMHLLQIPGLILLGVGVFIGAKGYLGIFANRFSQVLNRATSFEYKDDKNTPPD